MKPKVGILTLYYHNYNMGGMLQAYALQKAITKENFNVEQINYEYRAEISHESLKEKIKSIFSKSGAVGGFIVILKKVATYILNHTIGIIESKKINRRISKYIKFENKIPHSEKKYTSNNISDSLNEYDIFVCGGDQIWNNWGEGFDKRYTEIFTLLFVDDIKRKFSYSASTGQSSLSKEFLEKLKPGIENLNAISVREESSYKCISKIIDSEIDIVVDPVLLLDEEEWSYVACNNLSESTTDSYIFCYFLGEDVTIRKYAQRFAHKLGVKLLVFPYVSNKFNWRDLHWGDIREFDSGPAEFVNIIRNAKLVLTNSYHAMVFSVIFHKTFYVFERSTIIGGATMNTRITDFLCEYGLEKQLLRADQLEEKDKIDSIDYTYVDQILAKNKELSKEFLRKSLGK